MEPSPCKPKKKAGFSLIVVLIISLVGLAVIGVTMQFTMSAGGAGRVAGASTTKYNLLQEAVEEGKAALKEMMANTDPVRRHPNAHTGLPITDLSGLVISPGGVVKDETIPSSKLRHLGIWDNSGTGGKLTVTIYDMRYTPAAVDAMPDAEKMKLPPAIELEESVTNLGVYLVRATLSVGTKDTILESAVLQANNE